MRKLHPSAARNIIDNLIGEYKLDPKMTPKQAFERIYDIEPNDTPMMAAADNLDDIAAMYSGLNLEQIKAVIALESLKL